VLIWWRNVYHLAVKELASFLSDRLLLGFLLLSFTFMIYSEATGVETEVKNANVAVVDGDLSQLSQRLGDALLQPFFKRAVAIDRSQVDVVMDAGHFAFVLDIPPHFEADLLRGRRPTLQLNIDATAMTQAGVGATYIETILSDETRRYLQARGIDVAPPISVVIRTLFNPNLEGYWYQAVNSLIENITLFSILLVGAAIIREREHGTIDHLLVMPLNASEIVAAKVVANGLVVLLAGLLAIVFTLGVLLAVPIHGSVPLFLLAAAIYIFSITSLGIMLATIARTMPQFGLLATPVFLILGMLSGANSPLSSMPQVLQYVLQLSPTVHFVDAALAVLFRDAGPTIIWPRLAVIGALGVAFITVALARFRTMLASEN
jgi:ABC-2 type transport system permease protein